MSKDDKLYGTEHQEQLDASLEEAIQRIVEKTSCDDDSIEQTLARLKWPVRVDVFRRVNLTPSAGRLAASILEDLLERLDENNADPGGDPAEPTPAMRAAALQFVGIVLDGYVPWSCDGTGETIEATIEQARSIV